MRKILFVLVALLAAALPASAQWSIGAPGTRAAPSGQGRFAFLVFANPLPGREDEFNDWYQNQHMGDAVQLPGWVGAQRFRLVRGLKPPAPHDVLTAYDYLIVWDQEGADAAAVGGELTAAIAGGKSRRGAAFDYSPGGSVGVTYQVVAPRVTRPDGKAPFMPPQADMKTPRPYRYILMDYASPAAGVSDADYVATVNARIQKGLGLPGFMAAQLLRFSPEARPNAPPMPKYLVIWEAEGMDPQAVQDALVNAEKSAEVPAIKADPASARLVLLQPISPYITKADFDH